MGMGGYWGNKVVRFPLGGRPMVFFSVLAAPTPDQAMNHEHVNSLLTTLVVNGCNDIGPLVRAAELAFTMSKEANSLPVGSDERATLITASGLIAVAHHIVAAAVLATKAESSK